LLSRFASVSPKLTPLLLLLLLILLLLLPLPPPYNPPLPSDAEAVAKQHNTELFIGTSPLFLRILTL
jgi:hypothetical protein